MIEPVCINIPVKHAIHDLNFAISEKTKFTFLVVI